MSKETTAPVKAAANGEAKTAAKKANINKARTKEELQKMGLKGNLILLLNQVKNVCAAHNFEGTELADAAYPGNQFYKTTKRGGTLERTDEKSEEFKKLHSACKAAMPDLKAYKAASDEGKEPKFTKAIKDIVSAMLELVPEKAARGLNLSVLDDIKL